MNAAPVAVGTPFGRPEPPGPIAYSHRFAMASVPIADIWIIRDSQSSPQSSRPSLAVVMARSNARPLPGPMDGIEPRLGGSAVSSR